MTQVLARPGVSTRPPCPSWCKGHGTIAAWPEVVRHEHEVARIALQPCPGVDTRSRPVEVLIRIEQVDLVDEDGVSPGEPMIWSTGAAQLDLLPHEVAEIAYGWAAAAALLVGRARGAAA